MCASGQYTHKSQSEEKINIALNFMRSAYAPQLNAGVITANIIWYAIHVECGMVAAYSHGHLARHFAETRNEARR